MVTGSFAWPAISAPRYADAHQADCRGLLIHPAPRPRLLDVPVNKVARRNGDVARSLLDDTPTRPTAGPVERQQVGSIVVDEQCVVPIQAQRDVEVAAAPRRSAIQPDEPGEYPRKRPG